MPGNPSSRLRWAAAALLAAVVLPCPGRAQALFEKGHQRVYRDTFLTAIKLPVGGIGTGHVGMDGKAHRSFWWPWGDGKPRNVDVPDAFFAARVQAAGGPALLRVLETAPRLDWAPMARLGFRGEYPFGWWDFEDPALPVRFSLESYNPFIPGDAMGSAIPCAVYNWTLTNTGAQAATVSLLATQPNILGLAPADSFGMAVNRVIREGGSTLLHLSSRLPATGRFYGDMALMAFQQPAAAGIPSWNAPTAATLEAALAPGGAAMADSAGPSPMGSTLTGALSVPVGLKPGESRTVTFVLTWHFPNRVRHGGFDADSAGARYAAWWGSAREVAAHLGRALPALERDTRAFHDAFYASNLPRWMLDGMTGNLAILRSPTLFWHKGGFFGVNEGWRGHGKWDGNCTHVSHYAQAHAFLFPEIARTIREEAFHIQYPSGGVPFRLWEKNIAADGQAGEILSVYREYLLGKDAAWLKAMWPKTKSAMEYFTNTWDKDSNGVLAGNQSMTLDNAISGNNSWIGSLYLAALEASRRMALVNADAAFAERCRRIRETGSRMQDSSLFNGEVFTHIPEHMDRPTYVDGVLLDQLLGQYWAHLLDLGPLYPPEHVKTAMRNVFKHNFKAGFAGFPWGRNRRFVDDNDSGMLIAAYPKGLPASPMSYWGESQAGYEYAAAALMMQAGLPVEGFTAFSAIRSRYDGRKRTSWANRNDGPGSWGGDPFMEVEWGNYYFRSMASWSALLANQGYVFNGPERLIGFRPRFKPEDHASFFSAAEGWGVFTQKRDAKGQLGQLDLRHGRLAVRQLAFAVEGAGKGGTVRVTRNGAALPAQAAWNGSEALVTLAQDTQLAPGDKLSAVFGEFSSGAAPRARGLPRGWSLRAWRDGGELRLELTTEGAEAPEVHLLDAAGRRMPRLRASAVPTPEGHAWSYAWSYAWSARSGGPGVHFLRLASRTAGSRVVKAVFLPGAR